MLQPKWILFAVLFAVLFHSLGWMMNGVWSVNATSITTVEGVRGLLLFDYTWMSGHLRTFAVILNVIELAFSVLIGYELAATIWSGFRR